MAAEAITFSVIVCNYNDSPYLPDAIARIANQTRPPDQVIVVDDGSEDGSREILRDLAGRYHGIELVFHDANRGVVRAGLTGLSRAHGDFVAWWSVDDQVSPDLLEDVACAAAAWPHAGVIAPETDVLQEVGGCTVPLYGHRYGISAGSRFVTPHEIERVHRHRYLWLASSGAFLRRDALLQIGGWNPDLDWFADWFALYVLAFRHGVVLIGRPLSGVVRRPESYGARRRRDHEGVRVVVSRFLDLLGTEAFADFRSALRSGPLCLPYALGRRLVPVTLVRPQDWDLGMATAVAWFRHRLERMAGRTEPDIDIILDRQSEP